MTVERDFDGLSIDGSKRGCLAGMQETKILGANPTHDSRAQALPSGSGYRVCDEEEAAFGAAIQEDANVR